MNLGQHLWAMYLERHASALPDVPRIEHATPSTLLELLWRFMPIWKERSPFIQSTPYDEAYEEDADAALAALAVSGSVDSWDSAPAGVWRILWARYGWNLVSLFNEERIGSTFTIPLPLDATPEVRATATLLACLGGAGRNVPHEWRNLSPEGTDEAFPASQTARLQ